MAEPLKNMYNPQFFERICPVLKSSIPDFDCRDFILRVFNNEWPDLELKARVRHITRVLHHFLPAEIRESLAILVDISHQFKEKGVQGFETIFLADYIEVYGLEHPDESFQAIEEITKLVSGEFTIRPFILRYPDKAMNQMLTWSKSNDANVRRLSSEGCRPRLPWSMALPIFKKNPSCILPILENLKEDDSLYVRKSVANSLNDIAKDHPELIIEIAKKWQHKNPVTDWILRHGCRTLLKKGNGKALELHGFNPKKKASVKSLEFEDANVRLGKNLSFGFNFINMEKRASNFRLEYAIDYITSTGKSSRKIFKITEKSFEPRQSVHIRRKQKFIDLTTRKHYKGKHCITILANGKMLASKEFNVC